MPGRIFLDERRLSLGPRAKLWAGWCGVGGFSLSFINANSRRLAVRPASSSGGTGWPAASDASTISLRMAAGDSRCRETHGRAAAGRPGEAAEAGELRALLGVWTSYQCEGPMVCNWGDSLSLPFSRLERRGQRVTFARNARRHFCQVAKQCRSRPLASSPSKLLLGQGRRHGKRQPSRFWRKPFPHRRCHARPRPSLPSEPFLERATRPMASCSALTARIVSLVPTWPGPTFIAAADG